MTHLALKLKSILYVNIMFSKLGFVFVLYFLCSAAIKVYSHEADVRSQPEKTENDIWEAIAGTTGDSSTDREIRKWVSALKQSMHNDLAWARLGDALMQKVRDTGDKAFYGYAEHAYRQALSIRPANIGATIGVAWVYGGLHQFKQSVDWANKVLELDPNHPDAHGLIADAKIELGYYQTAEEHIQKMLDIRPDLSSYSRAAHLMYLTGDVQKATWLMRKAITAGGPHAENTAWCRAQLAVMLWNTGALAIAERELEQAIKIAANNYYVLDAIGKIKAAQRDYDTAINYYKNAIEVTPNAKTIVALGDLYLLKGEREKAEEQFKRVEKQYTRSQTHDHHGSALLARFYADHDRKLPLALKEAESASRNCRNVFVMDTLAWCYYKNGRYDEAKTAIHQALKWQTPDANILFHAGMIYNALRNRTVAQKYLYQALSLNPNFHPVYSAVAADTLKALSKERPKS